MITTTLNRIRAHAPCREGWEKLLRHLGKTAADDEPLALSTVLESNGVEDTIWCFRVEPQHASFYRLFAVWCAEQVPQSEACKAVLEVARRYALGQATAEELARARRAADIYAYAADSTDATGDVAAAAAAAYATDSFAAYAATAAAAYAAAASYTTCAACATCAESAADAAAEAAAYAALYAAEAAGKKAREAQAAHLSNLLHNR